MKQSFNYHTHTARCGHARGEDEEYIRALKKEISCPVIKAVRLKDGNIPAGAMMQDIDHILESEGKRKNMHVVIYYTNLLYNSIVSRVARTSCVRRMVAPCCRAYNCSTCVPHRQVSGV